MSNVIATSNIVCKKALMVLENMLEFSSNVNRDYESEFTASMGRGYAPGNSLQIKRPPRYNYRAGRMANPQSTIESTIPLTLSQGGCDLAFTTNERTTGLSPQALEDKLQAAMAPIVNEIDRQGLELAKFSTFNALNSTYAAPNTQALALDAVTSMNRRLDEMAAPRDKQRSLTLSPGLNANLITGFAGLFNNSGKISEQYGSGVMVDSLGIKYHMDQNIATHTNGAATATNVNGANQVGTAITVTAVAAGTLTRGSVITWPGVFAVNPQSRQSTGILAQFVVTADAVVGATTINVSPAIVTSGAFQNVTASPTTGQPYVIFGAASTSYSCSLAYHKDAFTLATVPLEMPTKGSGVIAHQETHKGLTLMVTEGYDILGGSSIMRIDVLFGWAATYPELAVKYAI
jgi:hypothetical protein